MNTTMILTSAAAFVAGSIFGGYVVSRKLSSDFEEWRKTLEEENKILHDEKTKAKKRLEETIEKYSVKAEDKIKKTGLRDALNDISEKFEDDDFDDHFSEREFPEDDEYFDDFEYMPPFQIDEEELAEYSTSELTELTYYQGDQILLDDREELITDICDLLGESVADLLPNIESSLIYVHNSEHHTNYEVHISSDSSGYSDALLRELEY